MAKTFMSLDLSLTDPALSKLEYELEQLDDRLKNIYQQALVNDTPIVHSIVNFFNPSPEDCIMLSKVFSRLSELLTKRRQLSERVALLKGVTVHKEWLYGQVGDHSRDLDQWLKSINEQLSVDDKTNESDLK